MQVLAHHINVLNRLLLWMNNKCARRILPSGIFPCVRTKYETLRFAAGASV